MLDRTEWTLEGDRVELPLAHLEALVISLHEHAVAVRALVEAGDWAEPQN